MMKQTVSQSKWWWFIPIVSIFYIEEQSEWAYNAKTVGEYDCRLVLVTFMLLVHMVSLMTIFLTTVLKHL